MELELGRDPLSGAKPVDLHATVRGTLCEIERKVDHPTSIGDGVFTKDREGLELAVEVLDLAQRIGLREGLRIALQGAADQPAADSS